MAKAALRSPFAEEIPRGGAVVGACNVALMGQSKLLAGNAGVSAEAAKPSRTWLPCRLVALGYAGGRDAILAGRSTCDP
jgi:hypothetical protein